MKYLLKSAGFKFALVFISREESILEDIQPTELHEKMQDPSFLEDAQLIDVREPEEVYDPIPCGCFI